MTLIANQRLRAFTLAELLIAMAVTVVLVGLMFQVFAAASGQWQQAERRTDAFRDARAAVQLISRDISRAALNSDAQMLTLKEHSGTFSREAYAVAPMPNGGKSLLCAVGYYTTWDPNTRTYTLKRLFRDSNATAPLLAGANPNFGSLFAKAGSNEEDLAAYAWALQFTPGNDTGPVNPASTSSHDWKWLEVRFKSISPSAAAPLRDMGVTDQVWAKPDDPLYRRLILPHEQQFVSRVLLNQAR
jgi:type II secretory pathway pseudopilin PulG